VTDLALTLDPRPDPETRREPSAAGLSLLGCLVVAARYRGVHLSVPQLIRDHLLGPDEPNAAKLLHIAEASGLKARPVRLDWDKLMLLGKALPAIVLLKNGHAMVLLQAEAAKQPQHVVLRDPNAHDDAPLVLDEGRFIAAWTGEVILVKRDYRLRDADQPFGLGLIVSHLLRDPRIVREVGVAALSLSLFAIAPIMFWRLLIDKVLAYGNYSTLAVLCVAMAVLVVFETLFGYLRRYLVLHVTRRVDASLGVYAFDKLLNLPMDFFEQTSVGAIAHVIYEMWRIRNFLSGALFGTVLDSFVLIFFVPVMFAFSPVLTWYVLAFCALICAWIIVMLPAARFRTALAIEADIAKNTLLVETLQGMRTVKSLSLDSRQRHEWDVRVAKAANLRFSEAQLGNIIQTAVLPLERMMTSGVFALAVYLFMSTHEQVYIGAMVAFMMLTQRAAAPLIQLSTLLQQYDEARLAVRYVAGLVNRPPEEGRSRSGIRTPFAGHIEFSDVRFRYRGTTTPALDGISFTIPEATIFGIMGRSGSGKTTVTRLLQLLHSNFEGLIKIDGNDIRQIDVDHLRSSTGVVLQENFLFRGTIRESIGATKPDATYEEIVHAARMAGAEEFIERLPKGYETFIEEGSPNLSGGQRQRIAIARALISDPRILILDEATSALDAESEAIINANLLRIAKNRTLIIISHRLSSLVGADQILVLERGRVYDIGRHDELLERCDIYSSLWAQQHRHLLPKPAHAVIPLRPGAA
jgi:ATP-binding cassette, subfamily B, bacterial HlyB/CyaB